MAPKPSHFSAFRTTLFIAYNKQSRSLIKMSTQKSITSFFCPKAEKRKTIEDSSPTKKLCTAGKSYSENGNVKVLSGSFGFTWHRALKEEFSNPYFQKLEKFITDERKSGLIYPPTEEVFSWTQYCDINQIKVIILGQDPYHGKGQAHGLAFSVKKGIQKPPSLNNIFRVVQKDYPNFLIPNHGDLTGWAKQGVLLLNACLTVRAGQANSHSGKGWEQFTDAVIKYLNNHLENRVFLLWGSYAQKKGSFINQKKHLILKTVHPSPLSAMRGFMDCAHFKKTNEYLAKHNLPTINWTKLD